MIEGLSHRLIINYLCVSCENYIFIAKIRLVYQIWELIHNLYIYKNQTRKKTISRPCSTR